MSDWSNVDGGDLSLIYHSFGGVEINDEDLLVRVSFNSVTWRRWEAILDEIGCELDRRRDAWNRDHANTVGTHA